MDTGNETRVEIDYTNWRGERSIRTITSGRVKFASNEWHPEPQWLLEAYDWPKGWRDFAMEDIHSWKPAE